MNEAIADLFRWPFAAMSAFEPPALGDESDGEALPLRGRNILVVEDESLVALLMADAFEDAGASVIGPCFTISECVRTAALEGIDAAVLDVDLGGQDVFPAADELKRRGIPFVFHTAHADREELRSRFGDVPVCRKPIGMDALVTALAKVVGPRSN
jgi:CheY-like chemotaxis protein